MDELAIKRTSSAISTNLGVEHRQVGAVLHEAIAYVDGGCLAGVTGVFLEGKPQDGDLLARHCIEHAADDALHEPLLLVVVHAHHLRWEPHWRVGTVSSLKVLQELPRQQYDAQCAARDHCIAYSTTPQITTPQITTPQITTQQITTPRGGAEIIVQQTVLSYHYQQ